MTMTEIDIVSKSFSLEF